MLPRHVFLSYVNTSRLGHLSQQIVFVAYLTTLPALNEDDYCEAVDEMRGSSRNGSAWRKHASVLRPSQITHLTSDRTRAVGVGCRVLTAAWAMLRTGRVGRSSEGAENLSLHRRVQFRPALRLISLLTYGERREVHLYPPYVLVVWCLMEGIWST
jgi:hypothetical protein